MRSWVHAGEIVDFARRYMNCRTLHRDNHCDCDQEPRDLPEPTREQYRQILAILALSAVALIILWPYLPVLVPVLVPVLLYLA